MILAILLLTSGISIAQDKKVAVSFNEETAKRLVVELEQGRIIKEELKISEEMIQTYKEREQYWKDYVKAQDEIIKLQQRTIDQYKQLLKTQEELYEKELKAAKPSIMQEVGKAGTYLGIGAVIGAVVAALLI